MMSDNLYDDLLIMLSELNRLLCEIDEQCNIINDAKLRAYQNGIAGLHIDEYDVYEILNDIDRAADTALYLKQIMRKVVE